MSYELGINMRISQDMKIFGGVGIATLVILLGGMFLMNKVSTGSVDTSKKVDAKKLVKSNSYKTGAKDGKVMVVEFADFQCPACGAAHPIIKQMLQEYKGKSVTFIFRHFPLPQHANAVPASEAVEAAGEQGKFWQMYDKLFESQEDWSEKNNAVEIFSGYAKTLGLDIDKFKKSVEESKYREKILADQKDGIDIGVNSTPTFFVNGLAIKGVPPYSELKSRIDEELKK